MTLNDEYKKLNDWRSLLGDKKELLEKIQDWIDERETVNRVYPPAGLRLNALAMTNPDKIKCVIIGQDPYIKEEGGVPQAMGLSFSVLPGHKRPRSLTSIYRELGSCYGLPMLTHGDLSSWAEDQGVLMLNAVMTVDEGDSNSHKRKGWEEFTGSVIDAVSNLPQPIVYLAWGTFSHKLLAGINNESHLVLKQAILLRSALRNQEKILKASWVQNVF